MAQPMLVLHWYSLDSVAGVVVALLAVAVVAGLVIGRLARARALLAVMGVTLGIQAVHTSEHIVQATYWLVHPFEPAYMTPWAMSASRGLGFWTDALGGGGTSVVRGMEVLHLLVNLAFLCCPVAMVIIARRVADRTALRSSRRLIIVQGLHCGEHVLLTATLFTTGLSRGVSTLFGTIPPTSAGAVAYRVFFHFTINFVGVVLAIVATRDLVRAGVFSGRSGWTRTAGSRAVA